MALPLSEDILARFLIDAKRNTYAAQGDDAGIAPLLLGSSQLEYREDPLWYRDIYFGMSYFAGQETVYQHDQPVWAMSYAGGVVSSDTSIEDIRGIYRFLRVALQLVTDQHPYRGPAAYDADDFSYRDEHVGDLARFSGKERIMHGQTLVYELHYAGGRLR